MGILNLTAFLSPKNARYFTATLCAEILIVLVSSLVLWFFWKGNNWARISVLVMSVVSVINLISLIHPKGNVIVYHSIVIAWAVVGLFLLYWLNRADVRQWFKNQTKTPNS
jgi:O-antigen/teichoic acid export membrane protein